MTEVFKHPDTVLELTRELSIGLPEGQKPTLVIGITLQAMTDEVLDQVESIKDQVKIDGSTST